MKTKLKRTDKEIFLDRKRCPICSTEMRDLGYMRCPNCYWEEGYEDRQLMGFEDFMKRVKLKQKKYMSL